MSFILIGLSVIIAGGLLALIFCRNSQLSTLFGVGATLVGCLMAIIPVLKSIFYGNAETIHLVWDMPYGSFFLKLDPLSAFFILPIFVLSMMAAVYGKEYLMAYRDEKWLGISWFFFNLLVVSMAMVCLANNTILFLIAWEIMALSSFFLVAFEYEKNDVRKASWIYMVASYLGTACLLPMFLILGAGSHSLDFDVFSKSLSPSMAGICFILALVGFGTKAGIMPFHVWLPIAHPAAPSPVSALMSGVMIKTGIYGLVRILSFLGAPPLWWGWLLVAIGIVSGVFGVLYALAQHDLKRLLAYHSVENIGIIVTGLGVGVIGWSANMPVVAALGFAGGLLHVVNHALFKGLLFLGAGSVFHNTHTLKIDHLGGLVKKMPFTALSFLIGAIAISGLPPLNGFISEFVIYMASFQGAIEMSPNAAIFLISAIAGLALIGGLAAACFTKAFGIVFLGEPRGSAARNARESGFWMIIPMMILSIVCIVIGLTGPFVIRMMSPVTGVILGSIHSGEIQTASNWLGYITMGSLVFIVILAAIAGLRHLLLSGRPVENVLTWDCGYAAPTAQMQYTASSFAQPVLELFKFFLRTKNNITISDAYFPSASKFESHTPDIGSDGIYKPIIRTTTNFFRQLKIVQEGRIHLYVLYLVVTLLILLFWNMR
ncbi:MAG TPA: proton-conducting transporter membrane subunit [Smithella sp.]|nr:proton-conducting transporter membrane subunit [Smithella sp.]